MSDLQTLEHVAADVPALTPDQEAMQQLEAEAANNPEALQALAEASEDVPEISEDQFAVQALKAEIEAKSAALLTSNLSQNPLLQPTKAPSEPLVQTRDGMIVPRSQALNNLNDSGPYNGGGGRA